MKRKKKIVNAERGKYEEEITDQKKKTAGVICLPLEEREK
jgi:hypothetical protein